MPQHKDHPELNKHLSNIRQGISTHKDISKEAKEKAIAKLDIVQSHVDKNEVNVSTTQHFRDLIKSIEHNPTLVELVMEALPFLPQ